MLIYGETKNSIERHLCIYADRHVTDRKSIRFNAPAPAHSTSLQYIINASLDIIICQIASTDKKGTEGNERNNPKAVST